MLRTVEAIMEIITKEDIEYVANLARLEVKEDEMPEVKRKLEHVVELAYKLSEVDTKDVKEIDLSKGLCNVFRDDIIKPSYPQDEMLKNAPTKADGCYAVPQTFDE